MSFDELAVIAAGVKSKSDVGMIGDGLFDTSVPICERARYARLRSGAVAWWRDAIAEAKTDRQLLFVLTILLVWGTPRTLANLSDLLSSRLDAMSDGNWRNLSASLLRLLGTLSRANESIELAQDDWSRLGASSPRLCAALAMRSDQRGAHAIFERVLGSYEGSDLPVLRTISEIALREALTGRVEWAKAMSILRTAYAVDAVSDLRFYLEDFNLPTAVAREICENSTAYPLSLVSSAEKALTQAAGLNAGKLASIAARDDWFGASS